jgi:hypothetical protein
MQLFSKGILLIGTILLVACSDKPAVETTETSQSNQPADAVDEIRTILIQSDTKCVLRVQKGRDDPELINPTSCSLTKSPDGHINSVLVAFNPPCKQYSLKNLIGDLYFLDEKSIAGRNKACRIESFKASYAWKIEQP